MKNREALLLSKDVVEKLAFLKLHAKLPAYMEAELGTAKKLANDLLLAICEKCKLETTDANFHSTATAKAAEDESHIRRVKIVEHEYGFMAVFMKGTKVGQHSKSKLYEELADSNTEVKAFLAGGPMP